MERSAVRPRPVDFSIVIPTRNRPRALPVCLDALVAMDYPADALEVIVVDDGGAVPLDDVVGPFRDRLPITLIRQEHAGPATARNNGAAAAAGRHLVFTDDDCAPAADWLRALARRVAEQPSGAIAGRTVNGLPDNLYATTSQMLVDYLFEYSLQAQGRPGFATSSNLAFPRDEFIRIGGFDPRFSLAASEDRELVDRWVRASRPLVHAPEVTVFHLHDLTLRSFLRQQRNYGRGACQYGRIRARRALESVRVEPLSFYVKLLGYPFGRRAPGAACGIAALLALSQVMGLAGYLQQKADWRP